MDSATTLAGLKLSYDMKVPLNLVALHLAAAGALHGSSSLLMGLNLYQRYFEHLGIPSHVFLFQSFDPPAFL